MTEIPLQFQVCWLRSHSTLMHAHCPLPGCPQTCEKQQLLCLLHSWGGGDTPGSAGKLWLQSWDLCFWCLCSSSWCLAKPGLAFPSLLPHLKQKSNICLDFLKEIWHYLPMEDKHSLLIQKAQTCHQYHWVIFLSLGAEEEFNICRIWVPVFL